MNFWWAGGWWGFSAAQLVLFLGHHAEPSSDWQPAHSPGLPCGPRALPGPVSQWLPCWGLPCPVLTHWFRAGLAPTFLGL